MLFGEAGEFLLALGDGDGFLRLGEGDIGAAAGFGLDFGELGVGFGDGGGGGVFAEPWRWLRLRRRGRRWVCSAVFLAATASASRWAEAISMSRLAWTSPVMAWASEAATATRRACSAFFWPYAAVVDSPAT